MSKILHSLVDFGIAICLLIVTSLCVAIPVIHLTGCMSDREYQLRKKQLDNQAKHSSTYEPLSFELSGPIKIELIDGAQLKARVTAPNQPFREIPIPDGIKSQTELVKHLVDIGAISVLGWKALDSAKSTKVIEKKVETPAN